MLSTDLVETSVIQALPPQTTITLHYVPDHNSNSPIHLAGSTVFNCKSMDGPVPEFYLSNWAVGPALWVTLSGGEVLVWPQIEGEGGLQV